MEGECLAGKYELTQKLGEGGQGVVWLARHLELDVPVAVKFLGAEAQKNPDVGRRFLREARAAAKLRSPHVVQIFDYGVENGRPFIVMECLEGQTLAARLAVQITIAPDEVATILGQVGKAVTLAHDLGIVHRDLKPENIFLVRGALDEEEVAKVLDFGIAKSVGGDLLVSARTQTGTLLGTPYYMSPEQVAGSEHVDHRSDIWALGIIAFECIVGRRPVEGASLSAVLVQISVGKLPTPSAFGVVPAGFDAWFARICARDPAARFSSAREAMASLSAVCHSSTRSMPSEGAAGGRSPTLTHPVAQGTERASERLGHADTAPALSSTARPRRRISAPRALLASALALSCGALWLWMSAGASSPSPGPSVADVSAAPPPSLQPQKPTEVTSALKQSPATIEPLKPSVVPASTGALRESAPASPIVLPIYGQPPQSVTATSPSHMVRDEQPSRSSSAPPAAKPPAPKPSAAKPPAPKSPREKRDVPATTPQPTRVLPLPKSVAAPTQKPADSPQPGPSNRRAATPEKGSFVPGF